MSKGVATWGSAYPRRPLEPSNFRSCFVVMYYALRLFRAERRVSIIFCLDFRTLGLAL